MIQKRRIGRNSVGGSIAEFGPVLWFFLIFILVPLFDLISFGLGVATVMLISSWGSRQAAPTATYGDAVTAIGDTEKTLIGFMQLAKLTPVTGNTGVSCNVLVTPAATASSAGTTYTFSQKDTIPIDTNNNVYQYVIIANYNVLPLFNFANIPVLTDVPILGKAVPISYSAQVMVEHPGGLSSGSTSGN